MAQTFVEIAVNVAQTTGLYDYHIPEELEGRVLPGCLVIVPFGSQQVQGVVLRQVDSPQVPTTRAVQDLIDPLPVLTPAQIELACWMAEETLAPLAVCIDRMLPPGLSQRADTLYTPLPVPPAPALPRVGRTGAAPWPDHQDRQAQADGVAIPEAGTLQDRLLDLLHKRGPLRGQQIDRALAHRDWRAAARALARRGLLRTSSQLPPPSVKPKLVRTVQLGCTPEAAVEQFPFLARPGSAALARRQAVLNFLIREPWPVEVPWVYAQSGGTPADLVALADRDLVILGETDAWRDPLAHIEVVLDHPPELTHEQEQVWEAILPGLAQGAAGMPTTPYLLHGVTGSGKTEIYLRAVAEAIRLGRQAIILVPEIALTPQTVRRFLARFPGQVGLVHSRLAEGERYDTWRRARAGVLPVIVGPRSGLFTPLPNLGLIVVDEAHDDSYYQGDFLPYYHAVTVALAYARFSSAVCLLGTATPDVTTLYRAEAERWKRLSLPVRILAHRQAVERQVQELGLKAPLQVDPGEGETTALHLPQIHLVDMREELKAGNRSIFSRALSQALRETLAAGQQAILFLNRRGTATFVFCRECGHSLRCPTCDVPLTFHADRQRLMCHYCGYQRKMPRTCPACRSASIRQYGTGTEKVESEVRAQFPQARTLRWDAETTRDKGSHEIILAHFAAQRANVLIGTQMLAKGLDLPMVTLVGAILADVGLNLPDFRAGERTFQVLTQVAGRAGRSILGGQVVLQTFQPEHYAIQAAARHDYDAFYRQELAYRRGLAYPPFYRLVRLEYRHHEAGRAEAAAKSLAEQIRVWMERENRTATEMIGPVPCFFSQIHGQYRWQIVLRGPDPASLLRGRGLPDWRIEVEPPSLL
ncbi:MAG TPA: primosomal protein N' [Anaerolineaceae bacterium]|nr:primosomal protein N' [Anaerolineaceae bacterium]